MGPIKLYLHYCIVKIAETKIGQTMGLKIYLYIITISSLIVSKKVGVSLPMLKVRMELAKSRKLRMYCSFKLIKKFLLLFILDKTYTYRFR
jgi:hypothetical protein